MKDLWPRYTLLHRVCTDITVHTNCFSAQTLILKSHRACWMMFFDLKRPLLLKSSKYSKWCRKTQKLCTFRHYTTYTVYHNAPAQTFIMVTFSLTNTPWWHDKTISSVCLPISSELQNMISSNERRMGELKTLSLQLQQKCSEPCKDSVEIQPITGTGKSQSNQFCDPQIVPISQEVS